MASGSRRLLRQLWRWWGVILVVIMLVFFGQGLSFLPYLIMTGLVIAWVLFSAPTYCGAINRRAGPGGEIQYCRRNSSGLLLGCHLQYHKLDKFRTAWWSTTWRNKTQGLWSGASAKFATLTGLVGLLTGVSGMLFDFFG